jgi:anti-sigma-K factor RskA
LLQSFVQFQHKIKVSYIWSNYIAIVSHILVVPTAIPSGILPSGVSIPAIPTEAAAALSSLMQNPSALQSYVSMASAKVSELPSQFQGSAYSALLEASKTLAAVQSKNTEQGSSNKSLGNTASTPSHYFAALAISIIVAVVVL